MRCSGTLRENRTEEGQHLRRIPEQIDSRGKAPVRRDDGFRAAREFVVALIGRINQDNGAALGRRQQPRQLAITVGMQRGRLTYARELTFEGFIFPGVKFDGGQTIAAAQHARCDQRRSRIAPFAE